MDTIITNATGYSSVEYSRLLEQAQAKGVSAAKVDEALIDAIQAGKDFTAAVKDVRSQLPDLASPGDNSGDLSGWVALPSPAAMFASVILKDAAEQRRTNRSIIQAQGLQIVDLMEQQADKIETGAIQKFACALTGAVVNMAAGGAGTVIGPPVSTAFVPRTRPSVEFMAIHLTTSSPICCATSAVSFAPFDSISMALRRAGSSSCAKRISRTGPMTCTTSPMCFSLMF